MSPRIVSFAVLAALCACATSPSTSSHRGGGGAKLKAITPRSTESAVLVIYRNHSFGSMLGPIPYKGSLYVDEVPVGDVGDDTYATVEVRPGRHSLRVLGSAGGMAMQSAVVVAVRGGGVEFVELDSEQGFNRAEDLPQAQPGAGARGDRQRLPARLRDRPRRRGGREEAGRPRQRDVTR